MVLRLASTELTEVLGSLWYDIGEEFELDSAQWFSYFEWVSFVKLGCV